MDCSTFILVCGAVLAAVIFIPVLAAVIFIPVGFRICPNVRQKKPLLGQLHFPPACPKYTGWQFPSKGSGPCTSSDDPRGEYYVDGKEVLWFHSCDTSHPYNWPDARAERKRLAEEADAAAKAPFIVKSDKRNEVLYADAARMKAQWVESGKRLAGWEPQISIVSYQTGEFLQYVPSSESAVITSDEAAKDLYPDQVFEVPVKFIEAIHIIPGKAGQGDVDVFPTRPWRNWIPGTNIDNWEVSEGGVMPDWEPSKVMLTMSSGRVIAVTIDARYGEVMLAAFSKAWKGM